jgi:hypothetical protein
METITQRNEFIAPPPVAIKGDIERIKSLSIRRLDTDQVVSTKGRSAWCLAQLIATGQKGFTTLERPAPRISHYVHLLRKHGLPVETLNETHGGTYRGHHGRYVLNLPVAILEQEFA